MNKETLIKELEKICMNKKSLYSIRHLKNRYCELCKLNKINEKDDKYIISLFRTSASAV